MPLGKLFLYLIITTQIYLCFNVQVNMNDQLQWIFWKSFLQHTKFRLIQAYGYFIIQISKFLVWLLVH